MPLEESLGTNDDLPREYKSREEGEKKKRLTNDELLLPSLTEKTGKSGNREGSGS